MSPPALASPLDGLPATAMASLAKATATYSLGLRKFLAMSVSVPSWESAGTWVAFGMDIHGSRGDWNCSSESRRLRVLIK